MITVNEIKSLCDPYAQEEKAAKFRAYMKDHFEFYGLERVDQNVVLKEIKARTKIVSMDDKIELIKALWQEDERELQYLAIDLLRSNVKKLSGAHMPDLEYLITHKSWWDSVDMITPNVVGPVWSADTKIREKYFYKWLASDHLWLQRSTLIFQLRYREKMHVDLLEEAILTLIGSKEFFIRKAQGWALREYSKTNPRWVRNFLDANPELSGLTQREASKYI
jgi:3-methyladenine DNA glycosylase AlkD